MTAIIKIKHMCKNTGYLVTFSNSSNIGYFGKRSPFQRDKKGNKVTAILHIHFVPVDGLHRDSGQTE
jgi:hypothetical protein